LAAVDLELELSLLEFIMKKAGIELLTHIKMCKISNSKLTSFEQFPFRFQSILGIGAFLNQTEPNRTEKISNRIELAFQKLQTEPISVGSVRFG
jgi:hypothetical protein